MIGGKNCGTKKSLTSVKTEKNEDGVKYENARTL